ncbi:serine protease inhibitor I/II-like isoform X2 [Photinus pyralis]|uniref:serine protease inhibitor I/II-like isoform X2 n=1 Tax=Photinus pyralis TaxID=7054 RepID=UPI0012676322|nr:serine protease inhibitor I/II-like isoform X2 [Photinus pyralis]XP_031357033.1 serine protease inhibitor I/II-like isoform X2 [Photinus pyralis]
MSLLVQFTIKELYINLSSPMSKQSNTMKVQLLVLAVFCIACAFASDEFVCQEGVPYKENECNNCNCNNGHLACTLMACGERSAELRKCEVGTKTKVDCNDCECVKNMGTICTNRKC